jgi:hypothetical protein
MGGRWLIEDVGLLPAETQTRFMDAARSYLQQPRRWLAQSTFLLEQTGRERLVERAACFNLANAREPNVPDLVPSGHVKLDRGSIFGLSPPEYHCVIGPAEDAFALMLRGRPRFENSFLSTHSVRKECGFQAADGGLQ